MPCRTIHFIVSGRVQGVFFRAATRREAKRLGISGWVSNLPDGRVAGRAQGADAALDQFERWLQQGPQMAEVANVEIEEVEDNSFRGFEIR